MTRKLLIIALILVPVLLYSQDNREKPGEAGKENRVEAVPDIPQGAIRSQLFEVKSMTFSKRVDDFTRGDLLNVEFQLNNNFGKPLNLYIIAIASYHLRRSTTKTFDAPMTGLEQEMVKLFVPFPLDKNDRDKEHHKMVHENFKYPDSGNKDAKGEQKYILLKFPKDPKLGVNPDTGKPYRLEKNLFVRTTHLSRFRANYAYFNEVVVLIFDDENLTDDKGNIRPAFKQVYNLAGKRK
jgi:hypothetical protein